MIDLNRTHENDRKPVAKLAYKPAEAAAMLSISERSLWSMMKLGKVRPVKVGRSVLYPHAELERFLSSLASDTAAPPADHSNPAN